MKATSLAFVVLTLLPIYCSIKKSWAQDSNGGCLAAGLMSCCQSSSCQVPAQSGGCFCDKVCYDTRDCCNDIEFICPPSGSNDESLTDTPPTVPPERLPSISTPNSNLTSIVVNTTITSTLFINIIFDPGHPPARLTWRKNSAIISSRTDSRVSIRSGGGIVVRDVEPADSGEYTVTASNRLGNRTQRFMVSVTLPVEVSFEQPSYTFNEGSGAVDVCVLAVFGDRTAPITLSISASSNSAQAEEDFAVNTQNLTFRPEAPRLCVNISIVDDSSYEGTEVFQLSLAAHNCSMYCIGPETNITIQDNDSLELHFEESLYEISESVAEESSHLALRVCVVLPHKISDPASADIFISTVNGTAKGGADFVAVASRHSLSLRREGEEVCECVQLLPDNMVEGDEVFEVVVNSSDTRVVGSSSRVLIRDNDGVEVNLEQTEYTVREGYPGLTVCITAEGKTQNAIAIYICTEGDTALDIEDYRGLTARHLLFPPANNSRSQQCVVIPIVDDDAIENTETFFVTLLRDPREMDRVQIGPNSNSTVTIIDNDFPKAPEAVFSNGTPLVEGNSLLISYTIMPRPQIPFSSILCTLKGPGRTPAITSNCSSGIYKYSHLPPRFQEFKITIEGIVHAGNKTVLNQRSVRLDTEVCSVHLVNRGVIVQGASVTVEWQGTGPTKDNRVNNFTCWKDQIRTGFPCTSPHTLTGLSPGPHKLTIQPNTTPGCRRHISRTTHFTL